MKHHSIKLTSRSRGGKIRAAFVVSVVAGAFVTGLVFAAVSIWLRIADDPAFTDDALRDARTRWAENGPADYDMTIIVTGRQPGEIHVEVRSGVPTRVTRDELRLTEPDRMWPWTVPGMFEIVETEADHAADAAAGVGPFATEDGSPIRQWVSFHEQFGYPQRYHRVIQNTPQEIRWEVTEFRAR